MVLCRKAIVLGAVLTFYTSYAAALGLGEIKLNSALNQPLDAEIELLHVKELSAREIRVGLATKEDFERTGVDRIYFLTDIKFSVDLNSEGGPVVKVTTEKPVREPFLDFIVAAQWPSGKLLREYTLLIDLPIFSESLSKPVAVAPKAEPEVKPIERNRAQPITESPAPRVSNTFSEPQQTSQFDGQEYGPIAANENLWSIASQVRPNQGETIQQTMLAIQRLNPEAFINNNINLLRRGQVLRIPDAEQITGMSNQSAVAEVATQNRAWQGGESEEPVRPQLDGSRTDEPEVSETEEVSGRVKLSNMDDFNSSGDGIATGDGEDGTAAIESQIVVTQEELDAATRESDEIRSRMAAMDDQIETMEKLIQVSNDELRALEMAAEQNELLIDEATDEQAAENFSEELSEQEADATDAELAEGAQTTAPAALDEEPAPKVEDAAVAPAEQPSRGIIDLLKDNMLMIVAAAGGLIILIVAFLFLRKRDDDDFDDDFEQDFGDVDQNFLEPEDDTVQLEDRTVLPEDALEDKLPTEPANQEAETDDVVSECDIHIAYGQYDQAEDKLVRTLEREPRNMAVRVKLLEVFLAQGNSESFDAHYSVVRALGDEETIARAEQLREGFDDVEPFDETQYDVTGFLSEINEDYESTDTQIKKPQGSESGSDFDFNADDEPIGFDQDSQDDTLQFDLDESYAHGEENELDPDEDFVLHGEENLDVSLEVDDDITLISGGSAEPETIAHMPEEPETIARMPEEPQTIARMPEEPETIARSPEDAPVAEDDSYDTIENELADIDFDLPDEDSDELDSDATEELSLDTDFGGDLDSADDSDFDELDLSLDDSNDAESESTFEPELVDDTAITEAASVEMEEPNLDFDLDKDLENAMQSEAELPTHEDFDTSEDELEDLVGLDADPQINAALEDEVDLAGLSEPAKPDESDELDALNVDDELDEGGDFDVDFDLDGDIDIEELDKELGELDIETQGHISLDDDSAESMEEPQLDFDSANEAGPSEAQILSIKDAGSAASNVADFEIPDFDPENDDDSNLEFLSDNDETATKLDLARAYIDMGDADGARDILDEIFEEGNDQQKKEAETLLAKLA